MSETVYILIVAGFLFGELQKYVKNYSFFTVCEIPTMAGLVVRRICIHALWVLSSVLPGGVEHDGLDYGFGG